MSKIAGHKVQLALAVLKGRREEAKIIQGMVQKPKDYEKMTTMQQNLWVINALGKIGSYIDSRMGVLNEQVETFENNLKKVKGDN